MQWLRLYDDLVHNAKVQSLPLKLFRAYINLLCLASKNVPRGQLPDIQKIAFALHVKPAAVRRILDSLCVHNFLQNESGLYLVHDWNECQMQSDDSAIRKRNSRINSIDKNVTGRSRDGLVTDTDTDTEQIQIQKSLPIVPLKKPPGYSVEFERFWDCYPRKVGKGDAFNAWNKNGHPGVDRLVEIVTMAKRTSKWLESDGRFIPNPATWINQKRWDDDYKPDMISDQERDEIRAIFRRKK